MGGPSKAQVLCLGTKPTGPIQARVQGSRKWLPVDLPGIVPPRGSRGWVCRVCSWESHNFILCLLKAPMPMGWNCVQVSLQKAARQVSCSVVSPRAGPANGRKRVLWDCCVSPDACLCARPLQSHTPYCYDWSKAQRQGWPTEPDHEATGQLFSGIYLISCHQSQRAGGLPWFLPHILHVFTVDNTEGGSYHSSWMLQRKPAVF